MTVTTAPFDTVTCLLFPSFRFHTFLVSHPYVAVSGLPTASAMLFLLVADLVAPNNSPSQGKAELEGDTDLPRELTG